jgi:hypothetical protein
LEAKIEQLVREHVAAQQVAARAAVERAFAGMAPAGKFSGWQRSSYSRRAPTEVATLAVKGLERPFVIVTGLDVELPQYEVRMHIALTRATVGLTILCPEEQVDRDERLAVLPR